MELFVKIVNRSNFIFSTESLLKVVKKENVLNETFIAYQFSESSVDISMHSSIDISIHSSIDISIHSSMTSPYTALLTSPYTAL